MMKYSIVIQWSEDDRAYIASLPEWGQYARTHGDSYEEALENAKEVLADLVYGYCQAHRPLPEPMFSRSSSSATEGDREGEAFTL